MTVHHCPHCSLPCLEAEVQNGVCPACGLPLAPTSVTPSNVSPPRVAAPGAGRALPFLLGLLVGCLIGPAALGAAFLLGVPLPGLEVEQTGALEALEAEKGQAEKQAREAEVGRVAARSLHAEALKALHAAQQKVAAAQGQKDDAEQRLKSALARLSEAQKQRVAPEQSVVTAKAPQPVPIPKRSFVRDWQLVGPFPTAENRGHDTVFPPEREPVHLQKPYPGFGGQVRWRPYRSKEDKIDLANFFGYRRAGAAYAVSWVFSDRDQPVTLSIGSDDGVCVWVNRAKIHDNRKMRPANPGEDRVKARFKAGWNEVLAKVDNISNDWSLFFECRTADGAQPLKLLSTSTPPPAAGK